MNSRTLRKKLDRIARGRRERPADRTPVVYGRNLPRPARVPSRRSLAPLPLEEAEPGVATPVPGHGRALVISRTAPVPAGPEPPGEDGLLYFDIESTGLACAPLFLIGIMVRDGPTFRLTQFLARDYAEEAAAVALFLEAARGREGLVSFNGKSYDLPYIRTRAVATGVPFDLPPLPHTDLLHAARRAWAERLPNCRLVTLERHILGTPRPPDIPSAEIPDAYHAFVRSGDARQMALILEHNRVDLLSMAALLRRLPEEQWT
jgi:uncharacterized protein YprB with RNaseH-like and TPR domain